MAYMTNLKNKTKTDTNEHVYKMEINPWIQKKTLGLLKGKGEGIN